ncbi:MAG TPA: hypothetical protein PLZ86_01755 [bacterium]|nr:hypothetical protein [bacterium]
MSEFKPVTNSHQAHPLCFEKGASARPKDANSTNDITGLTPQSFGAVMNLWAKGLCDVDSYVLCPAVGSETFDNIWKLTSVPAVTESIVTASKETLRVMLKQGHESLDPLSSKDKCATDALVESNVENWPMGIRRMFGEFATMAQGAVWALSASAEEYIGLVKGAFEGLESSEVCMDEASFMAKGLAPASMNETEFLSAIKAVKNGDAEMAKILTASYYAQRAGEAGNRKEALDLVAKAEKAIADLKCKKKIEVETGDRGRMVAAVMDMIAQARAKAGKPDSNRRSVKKGGARAGNKNAGGAKNRQKTNAPKDEWGGSNPYN